jgi:polygalacturonase
MSMRSWGIVALCVALAGCASASADIAPAYVSPVTYQSYTCQQLALEAQAVSTRAATLSGVQDSQRTKDQWTTAAAVVVFWPAAFLVQGDKQNAAELAQMKGQMVAIEQASIARKCNIQFQKPEPPAAPTSDRQQ